MRQIVGSDFSKENTSTKDYKLIAADVRDGDIIREKLSDVDAAKPTLVLTECLLVYMSTEDSSSILKWVSEAFPSVAFINYEMINPDDKFG